MNKQEARWRAYDLAAGLIFAAISEGANVADMLPCSEADAQKIQAALEAIAVELRQKSTAMKQRTTKKGRRQ